MLLSTKCRTEVLYGPDNPTFPNRENMAEHFIKTVRSMIQNRCRLLSGYECDGHDNFLILSNSEVFSPDETLGCMEGNCFFLNRTILYEQVKELSEQDEIYLNAPQSVYYKGLLDAGIIAPISHNGVSFWPSR
ncbi:MAG: hypothetical protein PHY23_07515 [Oscillospiraceae bacterium]|jgi:hypothetical protein|nr:hypothetical protein [Oscillospiraceae bacterium]